jgi:hypothetical protein
MCAHVYRRVVVVCAPDGKRARHRRRDDQTGQSAAPPSSRAAAIRALEGQHPPGVLTKRRVRLGQGLEASSSTRKGCDVERLLTCGSGRLLPTATSGSSSSFATRLLRHPETRPDGGRDVRRDVPGPHRTSCSGVRSHRETSRALTERFPAAWLMRRTLSAVG